jgi:hypothetical protein
MEALSKLNSVYVEHSIRSGGYAGAVQSLMDDNGKTVSAEIDTLEQELVALTWEFTETADAGSEEHGNYFSSFGFFEECEDSHNMDLENLAMSMKGESENNNEIVDAGKIRIHMTCRLEIQRVWRGHMGRRIYNLHKNASHEHKVVPAVIIMQSFWRQVLCSRAVQAFRKKAGLEDLHLAALHMQRVGKGMVARKATQRLLAHQDIASKNFFSSRGRAEDNIREQLDTNFGRPPRQFSLESSASDESDDSQESLPSTDKNAAQSNRHRSRKDFVLRIHSQNAIGTNEESHASFNDLRSRGSLLPPPPFLRHTSADRRRDWESYEVPPVQL